MSYFQVSSLCGATSVSSAPEAMAKGRKACMVFGAVAALLGLRQGAFVPGPARGVAPVAAAGGVLAMAGAAPAHADKIDDAAKKLSEASYIPLPEGDWLDFGCLREAPHREPFPGAQGG